MFDSFLTQYYFSTMTPDTLNFAGDYTTILGFVGVLSTFVIVYTSFRRFYHSPYNLRVKTQTTNETPETND